MAGEYNVMAQKRTFLLILKKTIPDEIESQRKRRKANKRKVVSPCNEELLRVYRNRSSNSRPWWRNKGGWSLIASERNVHHWRRRKSANKARIETRKYGKEKSNETQSRSRIENRPSTHSAIKCASTSPNKNQYVTRRAETTWEERIKAREINGRQQRASRSRRAVKLVENTTIT